MEKTGKPLRWKDCGLHRGCGRKPGVSTPVEKRGKFVHRVLSTYPQKPVERTEGDFPARNEYLCMSCMKLHGRHPAPCRISVIFSAPLFVVLRASLCHSERPFFVILSRRRRIRTPVFGSPQGPPRKAFRLSWGEDEQGSGVRNARQPRGPHKADQPCGERTNSGANETCPQGRGERCETCEDVTVRTLRGRRRAPHTEEPRLIPVILRP